MSALTNHHGTSYHRKYRPPKWNGEKKEKEEDEGEEAEAEEDEEEREREREREQHIMAKRIPARVTRSLVHGRSAG